MTLSKSVTTLAVICLAVFLVSFYGPMRFFSRPLLWFCLFAGTAASVYSIVDGFFRDRRKNRNISLVVFAGFLVAAGIPMLILFVFGLPADD
jgi:hypothetical protein